MYPTNLTLHPMNLLVFVSDISPHMQPQAPSLPTPIFLNICSMDLAIKSDHTNTEYDLCLDIKDPQICIFSI